MNNKFLIARSMVSGVYKGLFAGAWISLGLVVAVIYLLEEGRKYDDRCKAKYGYSYESLWSREQQKLVCVDTSISKPLPE